MVTANNAGRKEIDWQGQYEALNDVRRLVKYNSDLVGACVCYGRMFCWMRGWLVAWVGGRLDEYNSDLVGACACRMRMCMQDAHVHAGCACVLILDACRMRRMSWPAGGRVDGWVSTTRTWRMHASLLVWLSHAMGCVFAWMCGRRTGWGATGLVQPSISSGRAIATVECCSSNVRNANSGVLHWQCQEREQWSVAVAMAGTRTVECCSSNVRNANSGVLQ
eukprot:353901-Chlamydomonas_euryale.AAC.1